METGEAPGTEVAPGMEEAHLKIEAILKTGRTGPEVIPEIETIIITKYLTP